MKKIASLVFTLLIFLSNLCYAFENEPNGFRNFVWGESIASLQTKYPDLRNTSNKGNVAYYMAGISQTKLGNVEIMPFFSSWFFENKLMGVQVFLTSTDFVGANKQLNLILSDMRQLYGKESYNSVNGNLRNEQKETYIWEGNKTVFILTGTFTNNEYKRHGETNLCAISKEVAAEEEAKAKQQIKQGW